MAPAPVLPFMTEPAYARRAGLPQQVLYGAEWVEGGAPPVFPPSEPGFYDLSPLRYEFPPVTLTTLTDVVVQGRTNILTTRDAILRHELVNPRTEMTTAEFYKRLFPDRDHLSASWARTDPFNVDYLPEAAVFTDWTAFNYAHWITEVLPRIAAFAAHADIRSVPLLIDTELHPNIMRSIELVAGPDLKLHELVVDHRVRVGVLHNVSPTGYVPFTLRDKAGEGFTHGLFGGQALREMIDRLRRHVPAAGSDAARPKLFIRRNSSARRLVNEREIEALLVGRGFTVLEPERLNVEEQVAAFSNAAMVVGATGAALANIIFCRPDCPTVVIMPKFRETAYWYWRRMAAAAGAGAVLHVSGDQIDPMDDPHHPLAVHQDFRVEPKDILDAIEAAEDVRR
ncbi:MAG TPA: glycosyltransferase 61 family protein [Phenylobacterium sp.]